MATYWPDLILPTTLAESRGRAEDKTMAWSTMTDIGGTGTGSPPTLEGCVTISGSRFLVGGIAPASKKMGTDEIGLELGMTPRAVGEEGIGDNSAL